MIELLIVIVIVGIVVTIAAPSFRDMLNTMRQNSALGLLVSDLNQARGEAIKRNTSVLMCARNSAGDDCGTNWQAGWVVCLEGNVTNHCAAVNPASPNHLAIRPALDAALTLHMVDPLDATVVFPVRFSPNSSQTSQSDLLVRAGEVRLLMLGTWSGAATRTVRVAVTGNISRQ